MRTFQKYRLFSWSASLVPSLPRRFFGQESITTPVTAGTNSGLGSCGAGYNHSESLEPSPHQWCSIHGAGGLIQVDGTGCLSTGEPSVGVITAEGSCSLESVGGKLPRPTPPQRAAPRYTECLSDICTSTHSFYTIFRWTAKASRGVVLAPLFRLCLLPRLKIASDRLLIIRPPRLQCTTGTLRNEQL